MAYDDSIERAIAAFDAKVKENGKRYREKNKEKLRAKRLPQTAQMKEYAKTWRKRNKVSLAAKASARKARKLQATPRWADQDAIYAIYELAAFLTQILGEPYHVDHIVPLQSDLVCGLHWEGNLQILEAAENVKKLNKFWPDMP